MNKKFYLAFFTLLVTLAYAEPATETPQQLPSDFTVASIADSLVQDSTLPESKALTEKDIEPIATNIEDLNKSTAELKQQIDVLKSTIIMQNKLSNEAEKKIAALTEEQKVLRMEAEEQKAKERAKEAAEAAKKKE